MLWQAWESGTPDVGDATVLTHADVSDSQALRHVFREHPAWLAMIVEGATKGTHKLISPEKNESARLHTRVAHSPRVILGGMSDDLCTTRQLAQRLRLPVRWLRTEALAGRIPSLEIGRRILFNLDAVRAALAKRAAFEAVVEVPT